MQLTAREGDSLQRVRDYFAPECDQDPWYRESGDMLLALLDALEQDRSEISVSVSTSMWQLVLFNLENRQDVTIAAWNGAYTISYELRPVDSGWEQGRLVGSTSSLQNAVHLILQALTRNTAPSGADYRSFLFYSAQEWMEYITQDTKFAKSFLACRAEGTYTIPCVSHSGNDDLYVAFQNAIPLHVFARDEIIQSYNALLTELERCNFTSSIRARVVPAKPYPNLVIGIDDAFEPGIVVTVGSDMYTVEYPFAKLHGELPNAKIIIHVSSVNDAAFIIAIGLHRLFME